ARARTGRTTAVDVPARGRGGVVGGLAVALADERAADAEQLHRGGHRHGAEVRAQEAVVVRGVATAAGLHDLGLGGRGLALPDERAAHAEDLGREGDRHLHDVARAGRVVALAAVVTGGGDDLG